MTDIASLTIRINALEAQSAQRELEQLERRAASAERGVTSLGAASSNAGRGVGIFSGALSGLGTVLGGIGFAVIAADLFKVNRELESTRNSLITATGSAAAANAEFEKLKNFKIAPIVGIKEIAQDFSRLKNLALDASESAITAYANIAAATPGKQVTDVVEAVADAVTGEFERLKEFGIKAKQSGDEVALSFQGVTTTVKNSAEGIEGYLQKVGNVNFAGAIERQLNTIDGAIKHLGNSWDSVLDNAISQGTEKAAANFINSMADMLDSVAKIDEKMVTFGKTTASVGDYVSATWGLIKSTAVNAISAINEQMPFIARGAQLVAAGASESLGAAWRIIKDLAIIAFNGIVGAVNAMGVAVGTAAAGIVQVFAQNFEKIKAMAAGLASGIESALSGDLSFKDLKTAFAKETIGFKQVATDVNKGIKDALSFDYAGAIGDKISASATAFKELRKASEATTGALAAGTGVAIAHGDAHGNAATKTAKLTEAQKDAKKASEEQARLLESLRSPTEVFSADMEKITALYNSGAINLEKYNNALAVNLDKMTQTAASTDAAKRQQEQWNQLVKDANDLYDAKKSTADAESLSVFSEQLRLSGMTTAEISKQLDLQKAIDDAIKANPNQDPQVIRDLTAQRIAAEDAVKDATNKNTTESKDFASHAWEQAAKNIETSLAGAIEGALNGKGVGSLAEFATSIKTTLFSAISNALSAGIIAAFKSQNWGDLLGGIITVGATVLSGIFSKSATKTVSPSTTTAATYTGSGSFAIADTGAREFGYQFALDSAKQWNDGIKNALGGVKNIAMSYIDEITAFGSKIIEPAKDLFKPVTEAISSGFSTLTGAAETGAVKLAGSAAKVLGYVAALYSVYDYFSNLGDMLKRGNVVQILSNTGMMIGAVVALFNPLIGGLITLGSFIVGLFSNIRTPNYWVNTFSPANLQKADAASNVMGNDGIYTRTGNKSAFIGTSTAFGQFEISSHELSLTAKEMETQFGDIVKTVRNADNSLAASLNLLDVRFGQAGETMKRYGESLLKNRLATQQDASDLNIGAALDTRYAGISGKLAEGGTQAGIIASTWFDMLMGKFTAEAKKDNPGLSVGVAQFLGQALPALAELPIELVGLVSQSISVLTKDNPGEDLVKQSLKIVEGFAKVQYGFESLGATATGSEIVTFLGALTSIGLNASDSADQLVTYAAALKSTGQVVTNDVLKKLLDATKGFSKEQVGGYLSSFTLFAGIAQGLKLNTTNAELDGLSQRLNTVASASTAAANEQIKQAIAANNLGNLSQEAAVQQLILSGKLEKGTAEAANFGTALTTAQQAMLDNVGVVSNFFDRFNIGVNTTFDSFTSLSSFADDLARAFGSAKDAGNALITALKGVYSGQELNIQEVNAYQKQFDNYAASIGLSGLKQQDFIAGYREVTSNPSAYKNGITLNGVKLDFADLTKLGVINTNLLQAQDNASKPTASNTQTPINALAEYKKEPVTKQPDAEIPRYATGSSISSVDTTQLEIRLATALGDKQKALNLTREAELRTLDVTSASLLRQVYAAEDRNAALDAETARQNQAAKDAQDAADKRTKALEAEAAAVKIANDMHKTLIDTLDAAQLSYIKSKASDFYNQMLDMGIGFVDTIKKVVENGGSLQDAATIINIAIESGTAAYKKANTALTASFNDVLKTINAKGYTISDQIATLTDKNSVSEIQRLRAVGQLSSANYQDQLSAVDTLYNLTMDRYNAELTKVTALKGAAKSIGDYIDKFKLGSLSTLSPEARLAEARAQYAATLATAKAGDATAIGAVTGKFDTYAQAAKDYYASSEPYQKIIADGLSELSGLTGAGNDPAQQTAINTAQTVQYLQTLQGVLKDITTQQTTQYTNATQTLANEFQNIAAQFTAAVYEFGATKGVSSDAINKAVNPFGIVNGAYPSAPQNAINWNLPPAPTPSYGMDAFAAGDIGTAEVYARRSGLFSESDIRGFLGLSRSDQAQVISDLQKQGKAFASGGSYGGGLALVGEQGPELINFRQPGQVYNAAQTREALKGDNGETIAELREQNRLLRLAIELLQDGFSRNLEESSKQSDALDALQRRTRLAEAV